MKPRKENAPAANGRSTASDGQRSNTRPDNAQAPVDFLMRQVSPKEVRDMLRHMTTWYPKVAEAALRHGLIDSGQLTAKELKRYGFKVNRDHVYIPRRENGQWIIVCCEYYFETDNQGRPSLQLLRPGSPKPKLPDIIICCRCVDCPHPIRFRDNYIVRGEVWRAAGMNGWLSGYLHPHCLEGRLGRALTPDDMLWTGVFSGEHGDVMHWVTHPDYYRSPEFTQHGGGKEVQP